MLLNLSAVMAASKSVFIRFSIPVPLSFLAD
jgi:hypothetical protein